MDKDAKDYTYLNDYHRERSERAKILHLRQPKMSPEEVTAQYERQQARASGGSRRRKPVKEPEPPSSKSSGNAEG